MQKLQHLAYDREMKNTMNNNETIQDTTIIKSINISAPASSIWRVLTLPALMKQWIIDAEINISSE